MLRRIPIMRYTNYHDGTNVPSAEDVYETPKVAWNVS